MNPLFSIWTDILTMIGFYEPNYPTGIPKKLPASSFGAIPVPDSVATVSPDGVAQYLVLDYATGQLKDPWWGAIVWRNQHGKAAREAHERKLDSVYRCRRRVYRLDTWAGGVFSEMVPIIPGRGDGGC